eukprot:gnl/TRDRNA2_/TRDRNA2_72698_c1_seq1.p1 gnl/TRDRNA2_/TRDRNA2_72698_c1~~gnl/TRDRNA2_/TRDRNA2_72698_c1_seq1.p1  ORF type:complete len:319 (+),score=19.50 gnl/TRDRNA2_/TRDRNA2_72698_c1_seq1:3-959(+)
MLRHMMALYGVLLCIQGHVGCRTYFLAVALWPISMLGVTAGVHRLWAHQSYEATLILQAALMLMFSVADQGSIKVWALIHAMHHLDSDTDADPHNRALGCWHAHLGWTFEKSSARLSEVQYNQVVRGLSAAVKFHDAVYTVWDPFWSLLMPTMVASLWGEALNGLFVAGALRWAFVQHVVFSVNSMAHGPRESESPRALNPSAHSVGPRTNLLVTFLSLGEGWHDYHHCFPWDYAAAELGAWDQWNPTKIFIDMCESVGLASNRKRCSTNLQIAYRHKLLESPASGDGKGQGPSRSCCFAVVGPPFLRYRALVPSCDH